MSEVYFSVTYNIDALRDGGYHQRRVDFDVNGDMIAVYTDDSPDTEPLCWAELDYLSAYVVSPYLNGEPIHVEGGEPLVHPEGGFRHESFYIPKPTTEMPPAKPSHFGRYPDVQDLCDTFLEEMEWGHDSYTIASVAENEELRELFVYFFGENYEELLGEDE